jgi:hypothetical protein
MGEGTTGVTDDPARIGRKAAFDLRQQLCRHGATLGATAAALAAVVGGSMALAAWTHARRHRLMSRAHRLRGALARTIAHPRYVTGPSPNLGKKALAAIVSAAVGLAAKAAAQRLSARPRPMAN